MRRSRPRAAIRPTAAACSWPCISIASFWSSVAKGFATGFSHGGVEPFYPPREGETKPDYAKMRVDAEVLRTRHAGVDGKWYFSMKNDETAGQLLGFEIWLDRDEDPCEVYLFDYKDVDGGSCRTASRSASATRPMPT